MSDSTILCRRLGTSDDDLRAWLAQGDVLRLADFIRVRFEERYFDPIESTPLRVKNGFLIMAISCLTIEALESFYEGWPSTDGLSRDAFRNFLTREPRFARLSSHAEDFYKSVRCGILHQAETQNGWKIRRQGPMFEPETLTLNATLFHRELHASLVDYTTELKAIPFTAPTWTKAAQKLHSVLKNCQRSAGPAIAQGR